MEPPSDLKFKILNENTVLMSWKRSFSQIQSYKIQITSDIGKRSVFHPLPKWWAIWFCLLFCILHLFLFFPFTDDLRDFTLPATATSTNITNLTPDVDYSVSISSYDGTDESIPIFGQLTSKHQNYNFVRFLLFVSTKLTGYNNGEFDIN